MSIAAESYGHAVILNLQGDLTEDSLSALKQSVDHQLEAEGVIDLVLNFEKVPFIDSPSLEYLLELQELLNQRFGQVKLLKCDENIRKILEITRLETSFEICDEVAEAIKAIQP
ncbi:MAG: STAS domain-containing protein [Planctomycetota bacterium]|jgi:anti-anti-sigma factor